MAKSVLVEDKISEDRSTTVSSARRFSSVMQRHRLEFCTAELGNGNNIAGFGGNPVGTETENLAIPR